MFRIWTIGLVVCRVKIFIILALNLFCVSIYADSIESLFSPGDISRPHENLEKKCDSCHGKFEKGLQDKLCLNCHDHKDIATDIREGTGFHGRVLAKGKSACKQCHREHRGRKARIVLLNKGAFNHDVTDFILEGEHAVQECVACHKKSRKYNQATTSCYSCHKEKDIHKGKLGKKCEGCHVELGWNKSGFNHDKKTKFPLKGKHAKIECQSCHPGNRFKKTPKICASCHGLNDVHAGRYGKKCHKCHTSKGWKKTTFVHEQDTDYKLIGKHNNVSCDLCHDGNLYTQKVKRNCYSCHKNDDEHKGRNGNKCKSCHTPVNWSDSDFDHSRKTDFPLRGKHKKVNCEQCHKNSSEDDLGAKCYRCHKHNDIHLGKMSEACSRCHNESGWGREVFFEHDITLFPLIGMHAVTTCEECHQVSNYKDATKKCVVCHEGRDKHKGRFGERCGFCHNPNSWSAWVFDHDKRTEFKIDGAHEKITCDDCHQNNIGSIKISKKCHGCHFSDDVHRGGFGRHCERCHNTTDFSEVVMQR